MAESLREDFLELLADVREHLTFAHELGVTGLETDFVAEKTEEIQPQTLKTAPPAFQAYVPPVNKTVPPKPVAAPQAKPLPRLNSFRDKLEATKLSKISPSVAAREEESNVPEILKKIAEPINVASPQNFANKSEDTKMEGSLFGDLTPESATLPESNETVEEIRADIGDCVRCPLYQGRTKIVHTEGNWKGRILFVGEAPGANEDAEGRPFVGRAGQLLTKIIEAIGLKREEVLIGNVNRCRPPQNRTPTIQEARTCRQFLMREISIARPEIIVVMGNTATQNLLDTKEGITKIRGKFQDYYGIKVMPTFHPAYLLRDPSKKRETWEDMKKVRDELAKTAG
jgi:DNA polymerase